MEEEGKKLTAETEGEGEGERAQSRDTEREFVHGSRHGEAEASRAAANGLHCMKMIPAPIGSRQM